MKHITIFGEGYFLELACMTAVSRGYTPVIVTDERELNAELPIFVTLPEPKARKLFAQRHASFNFIPLIAPEYDGQHLQLQEGVLIPSGCSLGPNTAVERFSLLQNGVITGTDVFIGAYSTVKVGSVLGNGAVLRGENLIETACTVADGITLGAGKRLRTAETVTVNMEFKKVFAHGRWLSKECT